MSDHASQQGTIISNEQAARLLMITSERVRQLVKSGDIPSAQGGVPLVGAVQGYVRFLKSEERRTSKTAAAQRLQEARADEVQLRVAERQRELIPVEDAEAALDHLLGTVRAELAGLPARVTRDLPTRRLIDRGLNDALGRMADAFAASSEAARTGGDPAEAVADNGAGRMGEAEPAVSGNKRAARAARTKPDAVHHSDHKDGRKRRAQARRAGDGVAAGED